MRISIGARFGAALGVVLSFACTHALADEAGATDRLRELAARIYATTRNVEQTHAAHGAISASDAKAGADARTAFDAIQRAAATDGFAANAMFARKGAQVGKLLANLEHAQRVDRDASLPALIPREPGAGNLARVHLDARHAGTCASALTIGSGHAVETVLAQAGRDGSTMWLRVAPERNAFYRVDTKATPLDTEIAVFGAACPTSDADAIARDDDSFGLAAEAAIDARVDLRSHYVRVRNLGRAGRVIATVETAAAISGRVIDERNGQPIGTVVQTVTSAGDYGDATSTDENGFYLLSTDPGSYFVLAGGQGYYPGGYVPELYPDAPCPYQFIDIANCAVDDATLLTLADGQQMSSIDFALNIGGRIAGVVRDAVTGVPLAGASVDVFASGTSAIFGSTTVTDAAGRYVIAGLLTGAYAVEADASAHGSQLWNHHDCGGTVQTDCDTATGDAISVTRDALVGGIDFDLQPQARIHAVASAFGTGAALDNWSIIVYDSSGNVAAYDYGYESDIYSDPLPPGTYRIAAYAAGFFGQLWNGIDCPGVDCTPLLSDGTAVTLARGDQGEVAFVLQPQPSVSGTITEAVSHEPLDEISVTLVPRGGEFGTYSAFSDADGHYTITGVPAGDYYLLAYGYGYRATLYPDAICTNLEFDSCDVASATILSLAYGSADVVGIDVALAASGSISGHLQLRTPPGMTFAPIAATFEYVALYDSTGMYSATGNMDINGDYTIGNVDAGTYFAIVPGDGLAQVWNGIDCNVDAPCDPLGGTPIVLAQGENRVGIDFDPLPRTYVFGRIVDNDGTPLANVAVDTWDANDTGHCGIGFSNADGYYAVGDTLQNCIDGHRVSTDAEPASYENVVFDGILCPQGSVYLGLCSLDGGTVLPLPTTPVFAVANFVLGPRPNLIFAAGFDP